MTLRENATEDFDAEIDGDAQLIPEYDNNDEQFYVGVTDTNSTREELIEVMNRVLDAHDDVMQNVQATQQVDLDDRGIESGDYDTIIRVGHTLS